MKNYSLNTFLEETIQKEDNSKAFELENDYILDIHLNGETKVKRGAMVAYTGDISFAKESSLSGGLRKFVKKAISNEGQDLMDCSGQGHLYVADDGKRVILLELNGETLYVDGKDVLAFENSIEWDIQMFSSGAYASGDYSHMEFSGHGMIAISAHGKPLTLRVTPDSPVYTDPDATIAWSNGLDIDIKTDVNLKTLIGKSSGETFQMEFKGDGFVIVQPFEEVLVETA